MLTYLFTSGGEPGAWTGLENYCLRAFALRYCDLGRTVYLPIARFGEQVLRSDASHPDARGHGAIAEMLAETISSDASFTAFAARARESSERASAASP